VTFRKLELIEYEPLELGAHQLSVSEAEAIYKAGDKKVSVESPGPQTDGMWRIVSNGWVGFLPVSPELGVSLQPRVELGNLFRMLEYAYNLKSFEMFDGIVESSSLEDFYERLANVLARRVLDRARKGLYRSYLEWQDRLACIRGRVDVGRALARPWDPSLRCHFEEHTADIEENQILVHTLETVARSGMCTERVLPSVRRAFRAVSGFASPHRVGPADCLGRLYNRLNDDYRPMHALCRFFLEHAGPTLQVGDHDMIPFVLNMPRLFEQFVAEWMRAHLPGGFSLTPQYSMSFGDQGEFTIQIDLLLSDAETGQALCVLDTKYKIPDRPSMEDIEQVVAYAVAKNCGAAALVYPRPLDHELDLKWGGSVHVRSFSFDLRGTLEEAGRAFSQSLLDWVTSGQSS
jgi:5-methylcytosine-specific restriction enzyme subunit McrC